MIKSVVEPEPVTVVGLKLPVTPDGNPDFPKLTVPLNPLTPVTVTVYCALPPAAMLPGPAVMPREKSGDRLPPLVNVQLRCAAQPLFGVSFSTSIKTFFAPANPAVKVNARLNVSVFPDTETDDAPTFTKHWLFWMVPALPTVSGPCQAPALLARYNAFAPRE